MSQQVIDETEKTTTQPHYPAIAERVKAMVIDSFIVVAMMVVATYTLDQFENVPTYVRVLVFIFIFILYEPLFLSLFGASIGHAIAGIRVKRSSNENKNIILPMAILRYIFKVALGLVSLFSVGADKKSRAIHDFLAGSVVIYKNQPHHQ